MVVFVLSGIRIFLAVLLADEKTLADVRSRNYFKDAAEFLFLLIHTWPTEESDSFFQVE